MQKRTLRKRDLYLNRIIAYMMWPSETFLTVQFNNSNFLCFSGRDVSVSWVTQLLVDLPTSLSCCSICTDCCPQAHKVVSRKTKTRTRIVSPFFKSFHSFRPNPPQMRVRRRIGPLIYSRTFFPACAKPIPRFAQAVVLPTPPSGLQ